MSFMQIRLLWRGIWEQIIGLILKCWIRGDYQLQYHKEKGTLLCCHIIDKNCLTAIFLNTNQTKYPLNYKSKQNFKILLNNVLSLWAGWEIKTKFFEEKNTNFKSIHEKYLKVEIKRKWYSHLTKSDIHKNNIKSGLLGSNLKPTALDTYSQVQM